MNSLPFGQLKSFLKILIGVQYKMRQHGNIRSHAGALLLSLFLSYSLATPDFRAASATALATAGPTLGSKAAGMI